MFCLNSISWRENLGEKIRSWALFAQDLGHIQGWPRDWLCGSTGKPGWVTSTVSAEGGSEPLREEQILEHKSNEV